jgi:hypothetical protein
VDGLAAKSSPSISPAPRYAPPTWIPSICTFVQIAQSPDADYPYRAFVEQEAFAQWAFEQAMNVSYSNFKNHVAKTRGYEFASSLGGVWLAMLGVEDDAARHNETTVIADV